MSSNIIKRKTVGSELIIVINKLANMIGSNKAVFTTADIANVLSDLSNISMLDTITSSTYVDDVKCIRHIFSNDGIQDKQSEIMHILESRFELIDNTPPTLPEYQSGDNSDNG